MRGSVVLSAFDGASFLLIGRHPMERLQEVCASDIGSDSKVSPTRSRIPKCYINVVMTRDSFYILKVTIRTVDGIACQVSKKI